MDSGLLLLSSLAPDDSGFEAFRELGGEGLANKGMLWALWRGSAACAGAAADSVLVSKTKEMKTQNKTNEQTRPTVISAAADSVLVINTHLSAERDARGKRVQASQLAQLSLLIERRAAACGASAEIYVCGDFNLRADDPALDAFATSNKLRRIQFNGTTDFERSGQIDHILASRHSNAFVPAEPTYCSLSDHAAVAIERRV
jgi:endonuclease/exonuclease/phosphatase family metal-dependent hydrolase